MPKKSNGAIRVPLTVIFDGDCEFCSRMVRFLKWADARQNLIYLPSESDAAVEILGESVIKLANETIIVVDGTQYYTRAMAIFKIINALPPAWQVFSVFKIVPLKWLDRLYNLISRNRHLLNSEDASCRLPGEH